MATPNRVIPKSNSKFIAKIGIAAALGVLVLCAHLAFAQAAVSHELQFRLDPAHSSAKIELHGNFHTVEGSFALSHGDIRYDSATGKMGGEIVFDARSGRTGNDGRDRKMHKDVLESARFPEIAFRPDHAEGTLAPSGDSTLQVHGMFSIHGADHELTITVTLHLEGAGWSAKAAFQVPYAKWGMKNPSVLFLRVDSVVGVELQGAGAVQ